MAKPTKQNRSASGSRKATAKPVRVVAKGAVEARRAPASTARAKVSTLPPKKPAGKAVEAKPVGEKVAARA
ncbi:poly(3-hydroxyalkanoate) granule-associated protein PhaF, partial [bacterium]|nr:poly(3-hydroxyalkanoate) granule-associated protein PhaF [bacterium]